MSDPDDPRGAKRMRRAPEFRPRTRRRRRRAPGLAERVAAAQRRLCAIYRLDLSLRADHFLVSPDRARALLPPGSPPTGLVAVEEDGGLWVGLYFDPGDADDAEAILEETSHWLAVAWHAEQRRPVSPLLLELQAEVDRYAVARLGDRDPLSHFRHFRWAPWLASGPRGRYRTAHAAAFRYCRWLEGRFPRRADLPALLRELRGFYRRPSDQKLHGGG